MNSFSIFPKKKQTAVCGKFEDLLAGYAAGVLSARERDWVQSHLQICVVCREEVAALTAMSALLRTNPPPTAEPAPDLWNRIEAQISSDGVSRATAKRRPAGIGSFTYRGIAGWSMTAAAAVALAWFGGSALPVSLNVATNDVAARMPHHAPIMAGTPIPPVQVASIAVRQTVSVAPIAPTRPRDTRLSVPAVQAPVRIVRATVERRTVRSETRENRIAAAVPMKPFAETESVSRELASKPVVPSESSTSSMPVIATDGFPVNRAVNGMQVAMNGTRSPSLMGVGGTFLKTTAAARVSDATMATDPTSGETMSHSESSDITHLSGMLAAAETAPSNRSSMARTVSETAPEETAPEETAPEASPSRDVPATVRVADFAGSSRRQAGLFSYQAR